MRTRLYKRTFINAIILLFFSVSTYSLEVSGDITENTQWTIADNPVIVTGTVTVLNGVTLTIDPGVSVEFTSGTSLIVQGALVAEGTEIDPILFTSNSATPAPGDWGAIVFENTSNAGSVFTFCIVEYGGSGDTAGNLYYRTGAFSVPLSNSTFRHSSAHGINLRASSPNLNDLLIENNALYGLFSDTFSNFNIQNSTIAHNTQGGVRIPVNSQPVISGAIIDGNGIGIFLDNDAAPPITDNIIQNNTVGIQVSQIGSSHPTIRDNDIQGNTNWGVLNNSSSMLNARRNYWGSDSGPYHPTINPTGQGDNVSDNVDFSPWNIKDNDFTVTIVNQNIDEDTVWDEGIFWVQSNITVNNGVLLTINPGVIVKFANNVQLQVNGALNAVGTEENMIVFTSDRDDSYGGDTNGDGDQTSPAPGNWRRIWFQSSASSQMSYCIVKYGGSGSVGQIHVSSSNPQFSDLFISNGAQDGIYFTGSGNSTTVDNVFVSNNNRYGLNADNGYTLTVLNSTIIGNNNTGIFATGATIASIQNSDVKENGGHGIYNVSGSGAQTFTGNLVKDNNNSGIMVNNNSEMILFEDNVIENNGQDGIVSSMGHFINNIFEGNRYPIGVWGLLGNVYDDGSGNDNNQFINNTFNDVIALRSGVDPRGTLSTVFPEAITSGVYVAVDNITVSDELIIEPGVIVKLNLDIAFDISTSSGVVIAEGTAEEPIVFTSYRDASFGGKTNLPDDDSEPGPGDWRRFRITSNASTGTVLRHVKFLYGGRSSIGYNLDIQSTNLTTPLEIESRYSGREGVRLWNSVITIENSVISDNNREGILVDGNNAELTLRNSVVSDNGMQGIATSNSTAGLREVSNNTITGNGSSGVWVRNANIPQTFVGNTISDNGTFGVHQNNSTASALEVQYIGNVIENNGSDGVATSRARFIDNIIKGNRYPISVFGWLGNIYVDADGNDGNIIEDNTFNNAIALISSSAPDPRGTLSTVFPEAIASGVYVAVDNITVSDELIIEPGVIVKLNLDIAFDISTSSGVVIAEGTAEEPIVFTSYRDASFGGKTNLPDDDSEPGPGDWRRFRITSNASTGTVLRHVKFLYGGRSSIGYNLDIQSTNLTTPLEIESRYSGREGVRLWNSVVTIENSVISDNNREGILVDGNNAELTLRYSVVSDNGMQGIATSNSTAGLREVSNNTITGNGSSGVWVRNTNIPQTFVGNTISNNSYGLYIATFNNSIDTLQVISGNQIIDNSQTGMVFTRSYVMDNTITGNAYPLGLMGQLSLEGTDNEMGSFFEGNIIENNTYNNAITIEDNIYGVLGGSYPDAMDKLVYAVMGTGYTDVPSGRTLDVKPGTIVKFPDGGGLDVKGTIKILGTVNNKIVFTSWKDDTYGGDTNADSTDTVPGPGDWRGLNLSTSENDESQILNAIIRYGGRIGNGNLQIRNNSVPVDSIFVSYSNNNGIHIWNSSPVITAAEIHNNPTGIRVEGNSSNPVVRLSNIRDNANFGLDNRQSNTVDAENNYWGAESGPYVNQGDDQNLTGEGDRIGINPGAVLYRPFLPTRSGILLGDVSENGLISAYDASLILRYLVDIVELSPTQLAAADVSADGTVSSFDASLILQYVVGDISGFPGLGKVVGPIYVADGVEFYIEEGSTEKEAILLMRLTEPGQIFASQINFNFDTELIQGVSVEKTAISKSMLLEYNTIDDIVKIAMAGAKPVTEEGDLLRIIFALKDDVPNTQSLAIDFDLLKINENDITSSVTSATIREPLVELPIEYGLDQNYPNPFNPATTIRYQIPENGLVTIKIYDMLGREVKTLVNEEHEPGYHSVVWDSRDAAGLPVASGMYLYRIQVESAGTSTYSSVKRMTLIK